ncbi:alpha/beta fold hydrolase [Streptomyces sp. NPDC005795]|uniref:lipase family alpha/beta hydrolase n=1 Tax=Streptomyces sp. NPDC005795 TaxID=3154677 RepID=UPI0033FD89A4
MKTLQTVPFLPFLLLHRLCAGATTLLPSARTPSTASSPTRVSAALLRATALELVVLAGHALLYPTGITGERHPAAGAAEGTASGSPGQTGRASTATTAPAGTTALPVGHPERPPVVLLHGFIDNRSVFVLLRRSLARHGWRHLESLNHSPLTCDIRTAAELLGRHVEEICARTGHREIDIVGHSLGGLIARYYVQRLGGDQRVRTLVTLGTPHGGTAVAPLAGALPIVRQMRSGSAPIEELRLPAPGCRTRFVSFWSELDQVIVPVEAARIDHPDLDAVNVRVSGVGHLALPVHPSVAAAVREALDADEADRASTGTASVA